MSELRFATVDEALQHLAELENAKVVIAMPTVAPVKPKPGTKPTEKPGQSPNKQPRTIPLPQPKNRSNSFGQPGKKNFASTVLRFATTDEAFQYLANLENAKIVIK